MMTNDKSAILVFSKASRRASPNGFLCVLVLVLLAFVGARADWPEFRGPWGDGHVSAPGDTKPIGLPLHWSETNNIKWKTAIPYRGWATPVVMGGQVWLTTATEAGHDFFAICVDADTGKIRLNEKVGKWAAAEFAHATDHWRRQFRGDARVKDDADITDADIAAHNLVLWGDPASNKVLQKIVEQLPIKWGAQEIRLGARTFSGEHHMPVLIYPNPLNPRRYVVLNSGFTFREYDYLNNARQVPKLPDYAVVDVNVPVSSRTPGGIVEAGFFGERWELVRTSR